MGSISGTHPGLSASSSGGRISHPTTSHTFRFGGAGARRRSAGQRAERASQSVHVVAPDPTLVTISWAHPHDSVTPAPPWP
jgi:hypothetical protein